MGTKPVVLSYRVRDKQKIRPKYWSENVKGRDHLENERIPEDNIKMAVTNVLMERGLVYQTRDIAPFYILGLLHLKCDGTR